MTPGPARRLAALVLAVLLAGCAPAAPPTAPAVATAAPAAAAKATAVPRTGDVKDVILATTTSTQDSGLLEVLVPMFEQGSGYRVKTISVGTGAALALGARGEADVVLVHAPDAEKEWMAQGWGTERLLVMHNDFIIIGPPNDPAGIKGETSALAALRRIADRQVPWVSRDDASGTDQLEKALWKTAGLSPKGQSWYLVSGQGMGATLTLADQKSAYAITDRATYLARKSTLQSAIEVEGDRVLLNIYHVMPVNPAKFPGIKVNIEGGKAFAQFMVAPDTQRVIGDFGRDRYGQALFFPDGGKRDEEVG
ncbi:MAG TPA: substrate-binding domain-containing protein [Chloroflexota bacterium]|jgi:tungstate transport system substrate-binding protein